MAQVATGRFLRAIYDIVKDTEFLENLKEPLTRKKLCEILAEKFGRTPEFCSQKLNNTLKDLREYKIRKWSKEYQDSIVECITSSLTDGRVGRQMGELPNESELEW